MEDLVESAWKLYETAVGDNLACVIPKSIPILFFGNYGRYLDSAIRVVTVGLNPSGKEFPEAEPWLRFPNASLQPRTPNADRFRVYLDALSNYFENEPYDWFDRSFEQVLRGMGASYYEDLEDNVALHIDFCSPLATKRPWSRLERHQRNSLETEGSRELWHNLVEYLDPDIIILSIRREYLESVEFVREKKWRTFYSVTRTKNNLKRKKPYMVEAASSQLPSSKTALFVWGQCANVPFGSISHEEKRNVGACVRKLHAGG